jgi:hypothetical protein
MDIRLAVSRAVVDDHISTKLMTITVRPPTPAAKPTTFGDSDYDKFNASEGGAAIPNWVSYDATKVPSGANYALIAYKIGEGGGVHKYGYFDPSTGQQIIAYDAGGPSVEAFEAQVGIRPAR